MKIIPYSEDELASSLSNKYTTVDLIKTKNHFAYLIKYFGTDGLNAKTILIEDNYISKDFLYDYVSYYASCFENYSKVCKRVHFFDLEVTEAAFKEAILQSEADNVDFWSHYIGFIVVKPIPGKNIGYTVLKTYTHTLGSKRNFWGLREYTIHLLGNKIRLNSLAFQEQDAVLAACATTAIWCMLNKAAVDLYTLLKSPSQITKDAGELSYDGSRLFPNRGLNVLQICQAIFSSGLVSEVKQGNKQTTYNEKPIKVVTNQYLKKIINAYAPIGIPIILVIKVPIDTHGLHAITVSGFKSEPIKAIPLGDNSTSNFLSNNITRFYAHDDQWGPFARITPIGEHELETPWNENDRSKPLTQVIHIIVPVYPKIRIAYEDIEAIVLGLDQAIRFFLEERIKKLQTDLAWSIQIDYSENFKSQLKSSSLDDAQKIKLLSKSMPKYLWIANCYLGEIKLFSFSFDATNINNAMLGVNVISYVDPKTRKILVRFLKLNVEVLQKLFNHMISVQFLLDELK